MYMLVFGKRTFPYRASFSKKLPITRNPQFYTCISFCTTPKFSSQIILAISCVFAGAIISLCGEPNHAATTLPDPFRFISAASS